jgi:UDPglucose--hexose-1-phosphate uridylyltransferase
VDRDDGRYVILYAFERELPHVIDGDGGSRGDDGVELRWNALLGERVIVSTGRQERTFLPPAEHCPLCPTASPGAFATEVPATEYEIAVFENRFPSFRPDAADAGDTSDLERRDRANGVCEVVLYAPQHDATLRSLPEQVSRNLVGVWVDRYRELAARPGVAYVFIFENRGREIGVTLTHPHGQIYAFPFVPPRVQQEHAATAGHYAKTGRCLQCDVVASERASGRRVVGERAGFVAYIPFAARLPYEVHIAATEHRPSLLDLTPDERAGLGSMIRDVQAAYDALWGFDMPYTMSMHQRATDGEDRAGEHLHVEFMPPYRTKDKLKYLAGVETGAGTFINDTAPEEKAAELRDALGRATAS